jgi:hypothetical protein
MIRSTSILLLAAGAAACSRAPGRDASDVTTTSASVPGPAATRASSRTVDSAGFVDNAGRGSEERSRPETSGVRATETGSERPTGTPGSGLPLPLDPKVPKRDPEEKPRARVAERSVTAGAPSDSVVGRLAQALCDRESACERIGEGRPWPTSATCMDGLRPTVRADVDSAGCPDGFDSASLSSCLTALRRAECTERVESLASLRACEPRALCLPR